MLRLRYRSSHRASVVRMHELKEVELPKGKLMKNTPGPETTHWRLLGKQAVPWSPLGEKTYAEGIGFITVERATTGMACRIGCAISPGELYVHCSQLGNAKRQYDTCIPHRPVEIEFSDAITIREVD